MGSICQAAECFPGDIVLAPDPSDVTLHTYRVDIVQINGGGTVTVHFPTGHGESFWTVPASKVKLLERLQGQSCQMTCGTEGDCPSGYSCTHNVCFKEAVYTFGTTGLNTCPPGYTYIMTK